MESPSLMLSSALVLVLIGVIFFRDMVHRQRDLLSVRNFFLLGIAFFYGWAGIVYGSSPGGFPYVSRGEGMGLIAIGLPIFMGSFFVGELLGKRVTSLGRAIPPANFPVTSPSLILSIIALMMIAVGVVITLRGGERMTYTDVLILQFSGGFAACAMGLATYYLVSRKYNPLAWSIFGVTFVLASVVTTFNTTGRREWLTIFFAIAWTWYYATLRYRSLVPVAIKLTPVVVATLVIMISYSAIRHDYGTDASYNQRVSQLVDVAKNPLGGMGDAIKVFTPDTPAITSFIFEAYPDSYERTPLNGLAYVFAMPIPRAFWAEKPNALGVAVQDQLDADATLGPGILGHGWSEFAWVGIVYYGLFFGAFVTIIDTTLRRRADHPFFVAVIGAGLANVMALARGDTGLFFVQIIAAWISAFAVLYFVRYTASALIGGFPSVAIPPPIDDESEDAWDDYAEDDEHAPQVQVM